MSQTETAAFLLIDETEERMKKVFLILMFLFMVSCSDKQESAAQSGSDTAITPWLKENTADITLSPPVARNGGAADWRDEIIYFIMTDRFADGDASNNVSGSNLFSLKNPAYYHGGDLKGIADHVDYLRKLGVTSVWISPVPSQVRSVGVAPGNYTGFTGYCSNDLSVVDSSLTSASDQTDPALREQYYKSFIDTMHANGILVIQDVVVNHMGEILKYSSSAPNSGWGPPFSSLGYTRVFLEDEFPRAANQWILDEGKCKPAVFPFNLESSYNNYGQITDWSSDDQVVKGDMANICDLNTGNADVRQALISIYQKWAGLGVDGYRIDTMRHVEDGFWDVFPGQIRAAAAGKKFLQFGEAFIESHQLEAKFTMDGSGNPRADSLLNFELYSRMQDVFADGEGTSSLTEELAHRKLLRQTAVAGGANIDAFNGAINFIDNHDVNRFITAADGNAYKLRNALMYLLTAVGIPCIYYNTENETAGNNDVGRKDMPDFSLTGKKTSALIQKLIKIRTDHIALRRGSMTVLKDSETAGIFAFARSMGTSADTVFVLINTSDVPVNVYVPVVKDSVVFGTDGQVLENILYKEFGVSESAAIASGAITTEIGGYSMKIFKMK